MGLIFNEKIVEKWGLLVPWIVHKTHLYGWKVVEKSNCAAKKIEKKKKRLKTQTPNVDTQTKRILIIIKFLMRNVILTIFSRKS